MEEVRPQEVSTVEDCPEDLGQSVVVKPCLDEAESSGTARLALSLKAHGVEFQLDTRVDQRADVLQLAAKLEICLAMLSETTHRLERSLVQVGRLEMEVEILRAASELLKNEGREQRHV